MSKSNVAKKNLSKYLALIKKNQLGIIIALSILCPFFLLLNNILNGSIPFWFDPARDFLLALDNLKKPTLIGPPSGIPGLFYGPYWIWMISLGLLISRDPRIVALLISFLPYFTIFPYILYKFSKIYGLKIIVLLWLLFIFAFKSYATFLWNPNPAPLLFLILAYLLVTYSLEKSNMKYYLKIFCAGITGGLLFNSHISFGLGIFIACVIYLFIIALMKIIKGKGNLGNVIKGIITILLFILGFFVTLVPFAVFELRHNFLQSRALLKTVINAYLYNSSSVGQVGLKPIEIASQLFIEKTLQLLSIRNEYILAIYLLVVFFIFYQLLKKKITFSHDERNILLYAIICLSVLLLLFISSKNPVWQYHFIGVEIVILLLVGIVIKKWELLYKVCLFWVVVIVLSNIITFIFSYDSKGPMLIPSLASKKYIVEKIYNDSPNHEFSVFAYSSAIYTYDFDYLFKWLGNDVYHKMPEQDITKISIVYLIIPKTTEAIQNDFISSRTSDKFYKTVDIWEIPDGTTVVKRERLITP